MDWFKGSAPHKDWKELKTEADLKQAMTESNERTVVLFKHSTRCGISHAVLQNLISDYEASNQEATVYYLDLLKYRPLSNLIAQNLNIPHQSPQMIVLQEEEVVHDASHHAIQWKDVKNMTKV